MDFEVLDRRHFKGENGGEIHEVTLRIPADLVYFSGHFPGDPVLPGVVQLNNIMLATVSEAWPDLGHLERIRRLKYIQAIRPKERVLLRLERHPTSPQITAAIYRRESCCTSGVLVFTERESDG